MFFSVTKLYQSKDANLRRMVYLVIKDVCPGSDEVIIITSSLMKDMNSKTDLYRSNAIRVLCSITDSQLLGQIERYLKQVTALPRPQCFIRGSACYICCQLCSSCRRVCMQIQSMRRHVM